ncbi:MAG: M56 family metallopeptidase [Lachnoclostridium sp.]|nr:M56 family metallopeptidase [Lachnoclostridium sp.]
MISRIFMTVLNMSFTASYCIAVVLVLRLFLRKQPKALSYLLWGVVVIRLLCPFFPSSSFSLVRVNPQPLLERHMTGQGFANADMGNEFVSGQDDETMMQNGETANTEMAAEDGIPEAEGTWIQRAVDIAAWIWLAGMALLLCYSIGTAAALRRSLRNADFIGENQYTAAGVSSPFVFGFIKPRIYLPKHLSKEERVYVLAHEKVHIARKDYLVKILAYTAVCIHWFNPVVWLAFVLMERDMEMSCDEAVLRTLGMNSKKQYAETLLALSSERTWLQGSPLAFGEGKVKDRIYNVLSYRKKTLFAVVAAAVVLVAVGIGLLLNPAQSGKADTAEQEKITAFVEQYAEANCNRDGAAIVALYADEEKALADKENMALEKAGGEYTYGFSSPWPDSYRYEILWDEEKVNICYYAWTSDPHISVWKEEAYYTKVGEEYRIKESSMQFFDSITTGEEFEEAYWINDGHYFVDYVENGFVDTIAYQMETGASAADNTVYEKPETSAAHILNLTGGEGRVEGDYAYQAMVRYTFADGSEVMIPMYNALAEKEDGGGNLSGEAIWIVDTAVWNAGA